MRVSVTLAAALLLMSYGCHEPLGPSFETLTINILRSSPWGSAEPALTPTLTQTGSRLSVKTSIALPQSNYTLAGTLMWQGQDSLLLEVEAARHDFGLTTIWRIDYMIDSLPLASGTYRLSWWHNVRNVATPRTHVLDTTIVIP